MGQWPRWRIRDKCALLGHRRGRDAECGFCAPWARAEGPGGARGPGCSLAAEPPGAGRGCRPHLAERTGGRARRLWGAGREHGPGLAEQGAPVGTPRRLVSARAARPGPSRQAKPEEDGDKVRTGDPAPTTTWHPASPPQPPNWDCESEGTRRPEWFRGALNSSYGREGLEGAGGLSPRPWFLPGVPISRVSPVSAQGMGGAGAGLELEVH